MLYFVSLVRFIYLSNYILFARDMFEKIPEIILLPAEKTVLSPFIKNLRIILANYDELSFADFQLILSNTATPLGYSRTNMILSILERYGAIHLISKERPRRYLIVKQKLDAIIKAVMS